jgi:hypothetical protein
MTQDEIIELARQAGFFINDELTITSPFIEDICISPMLKAFAKLVAERKCEELADKIAQMPFGDTSASFAVWVREQA